MNKKIIVIVACIVAAAAVAAGVFFGVNYFSRPTVKELVEYNDLDNLLEKKGSVLFSSPDMKVYAEKNGGFINTYSRTEMGEKVLSESADYNGISVSIKDGAFYASTVAKNNLLDYDNTFIIRSFFDSVSEEKQKKRASVEDGMYCFKLENSTFYFNKDFSCNKVVSSGIADIEYRFEYGAASLIPESVKALDFEDTVRVNITNLSVGADGFEPLELPKGIYLQVRYQASNGKDYRIYTDGACTELWGDGKVCDTAITEDTELYLAEIDAEE